MFLDDYDGHELSGAQPPPPIPDGQWVVYADDDTAFPQARWVQLLEQAMAKNKKARMFGEHYMMNLEPATYRWHRSRYWWKGRQPETVNSRGHKRCRVHFCTGGFWAINIDTLRALDWPDKAIRHNGGDVALGSALYQQGWTFCNIGRIIDQHNTGRRGFSESHPKA
jgi:GT2 family glycosyltransferase